MNRLGQETSPYLSQHATNPVDWYPWGSEAFDEARRRDVPILLSVGYSACHWCHVMAHESFEDEATSAVMNELFVNIKVDREERPDVDAIYMDAVQAQTGRGGWPMTVLMAPDGRPFFGGTYFPREQFVALLHRADEAWRSQREVLLEQGADLTEAMGRFSRLEGGPDLPLLELLADAAGTYQGTFDSTWGGFSPPPKFPPTMAIDVLLREHLRGQLPGIPDAVALTLDSMSAGGIYDHLGGGFARYSTDTRWLVPHFEKMLYDQALLCRAFLHAWQLTDEPRYRQVLDETIGYVLGRLRDPAGGFHAAEDADSEGVEGRFYVWTLTEMSEAIGEAQATLLAQWYGVTDEGNFEGSNILFRPVGAPLALTPELEQACEALRAARDQRVAPGRDNKVLTEWNALMVSSLAEAAAVCGRDDWLDAAISNAEFMLDELRDADGRWYRSWQGGRRRHLAYASDYSALIDAFTRLAEASGQARWIDEAVAVADGLLDLFEDQDNGGVFTTGNDAEQLITRAKDLTDGATPSANSLAAVGLLRLWALTGRSAHLRAAEGILRLVEPLVAQQPTAFAHLLGAIDMRQSGPTEIVVVGDPAGPAGALVTESAVHLVPNAVRAWGEPYMSPLWEGRTNGHAYVCQGYACHQPVTTPEALRAQLNRL